MDDKLNSTVNSDVEIINSMLEILLGHSNVALTERIVKRFGTVARLFNASAAELAAVKGMPQRVAVFFAEARPAYRQALIREAKGLRVTDESTLFKYALAAFGGEMQKMTLALYTDGNGKAMGIESLSGGKAARTAVGGLCREGAARLAVLVNSPTGLFDPGLATLNDLLAIVGTLETLGAEFIDYVMYASNRFFSLRRMTEHRDNRIALEKADTAKYTELGGFTERIETAIAEYNRRLSTAFLDMSESEYV